MISAVAALITALVGVVVFLVSHLGDESGSTAGTTGNASGSAPPGGAVAWQDRLLLANLSTVDWDNVPPQRQPDGGGDTFVWPEAEISSPWTMVRWDKETVPGLEECSALIATHGISDRLVLEPDARYCIRTDQGRTVLVSVLGERNGWEVEATVWRDRA